MSDKIYRMPIKAIIRRYFPNSEVLKISRPKGGVSADLYIVQLSKEGIKRSIVIRQIKSAENEFNLLKALQKSPINAPVPLILDTNCDLTPHPFLILNHFAGKPRYRADNQLDTGRQIGSQLAAIHSIQPDFVKLPFLTTQNPNLFDDSGHEAERPILDILEPQWPLISLNPPTLIHGDFWPGNMLWQGSELTGIIDWEDAIVGNPLQDLAISRFDILFIFGQSTFESLTHHYKLKRNEIDYTHLPYWDLFASLRAIRGVSQWAAGWPDLGRPDLTEESIWQSLSWFIQQAMAKINSGKK